MSIRRIACGIENPSNTGTACVTPSPESNTIPVVLPDEYLSSAPDHTELRGTYKLSTAWTLVKKAGTLNVSKNIWAAISLFCLGFNGASVNNTGCYSSVLSRTRKKNDWPPLITLLILHHIPIPIYVPYHPNLQLSHVPSGTWSLIILYIPVPDVQWINHLVMPRPSLEYVSDGPRYLVSFTIGIAWESSLTKKGYSMMVVLHLQNQLWSSRTPTPLVHPRFTSDMTYIVNDDRLIC